MTQAEKRYRVLRDGQVSQRVGETDEFVERGAGSEIELTAEAAEHLLAVKYVEEIRQPAQRERRAPKTSEVQS